MSTSLFIYLQSLLLISSQLIPTSGAWLQNEANGASNSLHITGKDFTQIVLLSQFKNDPQSNSWLGQSWPMALNSTRLSSNHVAFLMARLLGNPLANSFAEFSSTYSNNISNQISIFGCISKTNSRREILSCLRDKVFILSIFVAFAGLSNQKETRENLQMILLGLSGVNRKKFRGFKVMAGLVGGPGGGHPQTPENFRKISKNFLRKLQKMHYFSIFFQKI